MGALSGIVLGLSGGVDSSASAALLLAQGYEVCGVTCIFHDDDSSKASVEDAYSVCRYLGINHRVYEAQSLFDQEVIRPFCSACINGKTPSPCVFCNRFCKIPVLQKAAYDLGYEKIATGHYARIARLSDNKRWVVKTALDSTKDQSYMLSLLTQDMLEQLVFPLGGFTKAEVRAYAAKLGLPVASRIESQDLCFVSGDYRDFLRAQGIQDNPGSIITSDGRVVGRHTGLHNYTLGQRKGLGVALGKPCFVLEKCVENNALVVGPKEETFIDAIDATDLNWMAFENLLEPLECMVKIRYRSRPVPCTIYPFEAQKNKGDSTMVRVKFKAPQTLTAPGQYAVFYQGATVLGGGIISAVSFCKCAAKGG